MNLRPINRDDVPPEVLEIFEAAANESGFKVICAGDIPGEMPAELKEAMAFIEEQHNTSMRNGTCLDCGSQMPNYSPQDDNWQPAEGWVWFSDPSGTPAAWQCPTCDAEESGDQE